MKNIIVVILIVFALGVGYKMFANNSNKEVSINNSNKNVVVYKSPTCGCCANYIAYLKKEGFSVEIKNSDVLLAQIKKDKNIPGSLESCHTTIAGNYFIEGHIPVKAINKLLDEQPDVNGIALPGMPSGSPGMPGERTGSFNIMGVSANEETSQFINI